MVHRKPSMGIKIRLGFWRCMDPDTRPKIFDTFFFSTKCPKNRGIDEFLDKNPNPN